MATQYHALPGGDGQWAQREQPAPATRPGLRVRAKTRTIALAGEFEGGEVTVRRNVPMDVILRLERLRADGELGPLLDIMPEIVTGWNFEDDEGRPLPVTPEGVRALPVDLFQAVMDAFNQAVNEGATLSPN